jgi:hypothetical protein
VAVQATPFNVVPAYTTFRSVAIVDGVLLPPPPRQQLRIEFIGDSITAGSGTLSLRNECMVKEGLYSRASNYHTFGCVRVSACIRVHVYMTVCVHDGVCT